MVGDGVLQVTGSRDLDLVNDAPQGASRRRRIQGVIWNLQRDNTLTETVEEGVGAQGQGELHQVQAVTKQNGELPAAPVETPTNDHPSPRTSGNDHLMQLLGKAKDACLRKKPGDFSDRKPCGVVRFNHVDTALLQEANDWVEKEWQEGPRSA